MATDTAQPTTRNAAPAQPYGDPKAPGVWAALGLIALYLVAQAAVGGALAGLLVLLRHLHTAPTMWQLGSAMAGALRQPDTAAALTIAAVGVAALLAAWLVRRRWPLLWTHASPPGFGFTLPQSTIGWLLAAVAIGVFAPLLGGLLTQFLANGREISQDIQQLVRDVPLAWRVALMLVAVSLAPLIEELLFRGVLLSALIPRCSVPLAALLSATGFAAIHLPGLQWQWYALPELVLLGVALAWLRLHYRSLWPAVLAHGTNNALALAVLFGTPGATG